MNLFSARLSYEKFTPDDIDYYIKLAMSREIMKYITGKALSEEETRAQFEKVMKINALYPGSGYFSVKTIDDNIFIGLAKLVYTENEEAEIGYTLLPEFWNKKYATEITGFLINLAVQADNIKTLTAIVDPENPASIRVLEKHQFRLYRKGLDKGLPSEWYKLDI